MSDKHTSSSSKQPIQYQSADIKKKPKAELITNVDKSKKPKKPINQAKVCRHQNLLAAALALFVIAGVALGIFLLTANQSEVQTGTGIDTSGLAQPGEEGMMDREAAVIYNGSDEQQQAVLEDYDRAIQEAERQQDTDKAFEFQYNKSRFTNNTGRYEDAIVSYEALLDKTTDDIVRGDLYESIINSASATGDLATVVSYIHKLFALPEESKSRRNLNYYQDILDRSLKELEQ
jgi:cytochrome c-type biogenesis protein CcmH/NrfG